MAAARLPLACLIPAAVLGSDPAQAQSLDGTWRGTTSGMPSGGNCRPFTFDVSIRGASATGTATTPHSGPSVQWTVGGAVSGARVILLVESTDRRLRRPSTRWRGELRAGALYLEQIGSQACDPTRAGALKRS
ncbi:MAG TPA: hypothetical protein VIF14_15825 [Alphaproteobacteria bacterium]|jgi:hypothetical protein